MIQTKAWLRSIAALIWSKCVHTFESYLKEKSRVPREYDSKFMNARPIWFMLSDHLFVWFFFAAAWNATNHGPTQSLRGWSMHAAFWSANMFCAQGQLNSHWSACIFIKTMNLPSQADTPWKFLCLLFKFNRQCNFAKIKQAFGVSAYPQTCDRHDFVIFFLSIRCLFRIAMDQAVCPFGSCKKEIDKECYMVYPVLRWDGTLLQGEEYKIWNFLERWVLDKRNCAFDDFSKMSLTCKAMKPAQVVAMISTALDRLWKNAKNNILNER